MTGSWDAMVADELSRMQILPTSSQAGLASFSTRPRPTEGAEIVAVDRCQPAVDTEIESGQGAV